MNYHDALDQISEIHQQLAKGEVFRDYRALPIGLGGVMAIAAAALQDRLIDGQNGAQFGLYWMAVAVACAAISASGIMYAYVRRSGPFARRHTLIVVGQFVPSLIAGAGLGLLLAQAESGAGAHRLLPGLWAMLLSLGIFASRPYLPRAVGAVALYYLVCGLALLAWLRLDFSNAAFAMGLTFGAGQLLSAAVLYWNLERRR